MIKKGDKYKMRSGEVFMVTNIDLKLRWPITVVASSGATHKYTMLGFLWDIDDIENLDLMNPVALINARKFYDEEML